MSIETSGTYLKDIADELRKLYELYRSGALSAEEYGKAKELLLYAPENYDTLLNLTSEPKFQEDFGERNWWSKWHPDCGGDTLRAAPANTEVVSIDANGSKALVVTIPKGDNWGANFSHNMAATGWKPSKVRFQYDIMFDNTWRADRDLKGKTGKLPGVSSHCGFAADEGGYIYPPAGSAGSKIYPLRRPNGSNGWSSRMLFNVKEEGVHLGYYVYHVDQSGWYGDADLWSRGSNPNSGIVELNRWHTVGGQINVNEPKNRQSGGFVGYLCETPGDIWNSKAWWKIPGYCLCWDRFLPVQNFWFTVYIGGKTVAPRDLKIYFANIIIWYG